MPVTITAKTSTADLRNKIKTYSEITSKDGADALRRHARIAAVDLCNSMAPYSHKRGAQAKAEGEGAVQRDILKVYYPATGGRFRSQATGIARGYLQGKGRSNASEAAEKFKDRLLRYQMNDNTEALAKIAADMKFRDVMVDRFDSNRHRQERDSKGRVNRNAAPALVIGAEKELERYIDKTKKKVGLTKAGFAKAAAAIRTSREGDPMAGIPAWVKRHVGRASGAINDRTHGGLLNRNIGVRMMNQTPWASNTITPSQIAKSLQITRNKFVKYMNTQIRYELKRRAGLK
jgi:hypothetical protein